MGYEVAKEEFALPVNNYFTKKDKQGSLQIEKKDDKVIVKSGKVAYEFSTQNGRSLVSMTNDNQRIFNELPRLNFGEHQQTTTMVSGHNIT